MELRGGVVEPGDVAEVCGAIDRIPLEDLGIEPAVGQAWPPAAPGSVRGVLHARLQQLQASTGAEVIRYLHIHEDDLMTIGIFQLPEGARIPLHNHPGMTVFSRLLFGSLHIRAYDWAEPDGAAGGVGEQLSRQPHHAHAHTRGAGGSEDDDDDDDCASGAAPRRGTRAGKGAPGSHDDSMDSGSSNASSSASSCSALGGVRAARLVADRVLTAPAPTSVLFPADGGNIHSFTALSSCAVLDVLTPPYAPACGRDCTYYREVFPPQLLDDGGRPLVMPAEDVAGWVRWQQGARAGRAAAGFWQAPGAAQQQQQQQQREVWREPRRSSCDSSRDTDGDYILEDAAPDPQQQQQQRQRQQQQQPHPWAALPVAQQGLVVGLEPAAMPHDFLVDRGAYTGKGVSS